MSPVRLWERPGTHHGNDILHPSPESQRHTVEALMNKKVFAGKFEVQGEIAKGQTGTIYYGYDMGLRQEVAIKIYHSHINGRLLRGKAFIDKSKPLLLLDHPNLIKIFKVEEEDDTPVVFMEFFDAPSLQQVIYDKGPLPVEEMLMLAREITEVLVHTHFQGIIHGTLHPGHVLVGPQGQIKVMDLGLSWILMDILSNCDAELLRPLPYLPPELAKGELLNVSSDLYCLGFMMYDMLNRGVPYSGLPKTSIMGKLAFDQTDPSFEFPDSVPEAICGLIRHMTRNKSQYRLQDATHVLTVINQQLAKLPVAGSHSGSVLWSSQSAPAARPAPAPAPEPPPVETTATPSETPTPTLTQTPPVQRPRRTANYGRVNTAKALRKFGFLLGLVLIIAGAALGYWYRDLIDPPSPPVSSGFETSAPEILLPQVSPSQEDFLGPFSPDSLNNQKPLIDPEGPLNTETEPLPTSHIPTTEALSQDTPGKVDEAKSVPGTKPGKPEVPPPTTAAEGTASKPPVATKESGEPMKLAPKKPKAAPVQENPSVTPQPAAKKNLVPVKPTLPIQQPSSAIPKTSRKVAPPVTKKPVSPERSSRAPLKSPEIPKAPGSVSATPDPLDDPESPEFKALLESIDSPEAGRLLPTEGPKSFAPFSPSPPPSLRSES